MGLVSEWLFQVFASDADLALPSLVFRTISDTAKTRKRPDNFFKAGFWIKDVVIYLLCVHNDVST